MANLAGLSAAGEELAISLIFGIVGELRGSTGLLGMLASGGICAVAYWRTSSRCWRMPPRRKAAGTSPSNRGVDYRIYAGEPPNERMHFNFYVPGGRKGKGLPKADREVFMKHFQYRNP